MQVQRWWAEAKFADGSAVVDGGGVVINSREL